MDNNSILEYFEREVLLESLKVKDFHAIILIGSFAYPEFARPNSDIDIIGVCKSKQVRHFTKIIKRPDNKILELRVMSDDDFRRFILKCELPKLFAFIRGYSFILENNNSHQIKSYVEIGINRYKTDSFKLACLLKELDFKSEILGARLQLTDAFSYINNSRIKNNSLLIYLRIAEILKDFITHYWKLTLIQELQEVQRIDFDFHKKILEDIGLFRVFSDVKGSRILDYEKYSIKDEIAKIIQLLINPADIHETKQQLEKIFLNRFSLSLFVDQKEDIETKWDIV
jgi:hypothetical protein